MQLRGLPNRCHCCSRWCSGFCLLPLSQHLCLCAMLHRPWLCWWIGSQRIRRRGGASQRCSCPSFWICPSPCWGWRDPWKPCSMARGPWKWTHRTPRPSSAVARSGPLHVKPLLFNIRSEVGDSPSPQSHSSYWTAAWPFVWYITCEFSILVFTVLQHLFWSNTSKLE